MPQDQVQPADFPHEPLAVDDLGVPRSLVADLVLRRTLLDGQTSTLELANALCVSPVLMEEVLEGLRHAELIEVHGREGRNYLVGVTDDGHEQAMERMAVSRYAGPVPVSLEDYAETVRRQDLPPVVSHDSVRSAFDDLVISDELLDTLGPAIRSDGAIFLYGPPGTGKSAIAERLIRVHHDAVLVPHTVEVDSQVITVFDPVMHLPIDPQPARLDRRWVLCRRPAVIVGGELTAHQLDLTYEPHSGMYLAPIQMQANNGILVVDDFGRQTLTPEQLLNRWIVPLDRSIDYLTLDYGVKFEIPCITKIVFSTNLEPSTLADEAFFRRIRSKVFIPPIGEEPFDEILRRVSEATGVIVAPDAPTYLREASRERGDGDLRPYLPGAVCDLVRSITSYDDTSPVLDRDMVDRIVELYFTHDPGMRAAASHAHEPPSQPLPPVERPAPDHPDASGVLIDAVLEATHRLVWATAPTDVLSITDALALALRPPDDGGAVITVPAVDGIVLEALAPDSSDQRQRLETLLGQYVADARRSIELASPAPTPAVALDLDPETGLASRAAVNQVLGRLTEDDIVVLVQLDETADDHGREGLIADFARAVAAESRGHDHLGRYGADQFVTVLCSGGGEEAAMAFLDRLERRWSQERPSPVAFTAGAAPARPDPTVALVAAQHALDRADPTSDTPWETAVAADYR